MLKEKRQEAKLSQRRLSELSGVPKRTIQDWERKGVDHATVGNLKKVTAVFYDGELCLYVWGLKTFGTSWSVLPAPEIH